MKGILKIGYDLSGKRSVRSYLQRSQDCLLALDMHHMRCSYVISAFSVNPGTIHDHAMAVYIPAWIII